MSGDADGAVVGTVDVESPRVGAFGPAAQALVEGSVQALLSLWRSVTHPAGAPRRDGCEWCRVNRSGGAYGGRDDTR